MHSVISDMLAVNFDAPSSPTINLKLAGDTEGDSSLGWGFGWYPGKQQSAIVVKDPSAPGSSIVTSAISNWSNFRSNVFSAR